MAFSLASGPGSRGGSAGHEGDVHDKDGRGAAAVASLRRAARRLRTASMAQTFFNMDTSEAMPSAAAYRIALTLGAPHKPAQGCGTKAVPRQGHNTPLPLERSPPVSFKRLLG